MLPPDFVHSEQSQRRREWQHVEHRAVCEKGAEQLLRGDCAPELEHHERLEYAKPSRHVADEPTGLRQQKDTDECREAYVCSIWQQDVQHECSERPVHDGDEQLAGHQPRRGDGDLDVPNAQRPAACEEAPPHVRARSEYAGGGEGAHQHDREVQSFEARRRLGHTNDAGERQDA